jgi:signal transduction histidine kinase
VIRTVQLSRRWLDARQLVIGLSLVVAALALLAYWAWQASVRRHEVTLELLRSHAHLAAQRLGARMTDEMYIGAMAVFRSLPQGADIRTIDPAKVYEIAHGIQACRCAAPFHPAYALRTDLTAEGTHVAGEALPSETRDALIAALRRQVKQLPFAWDMSVLSSVPELRGRIVIFGRTVKADSTAPLIAFAADSATFRKYVIHPLICNTPLFTAGVPPKGTPNDSLVSLSVTDAAGVQIFRTVTPVDELLSRSVRLPTIFGEFTVTASLRPQAAKLIFPGGVPRSPVPMLVALLATATVLVGAAILLIWRMHELSRMRADFTSSVSHELRTPLTQILLFAETIEMGRQRSPSARAEAIGVITRETRRLIHLVENILQFSRAERSLTQLQVRAHEIGEIVADTVETFTPVAQSRGAAIELRIPAPVWANVDLDAVRRILLNLLDNAVRYGPPEQQITVTATRVGSWARIVVEDEGPGIPVDKRDSIWRPFVRLDGVTEDSTTGCGIGLAIVNDLVSLQGGRRSVGASVRGGAAFVIELPAVKGPIEDPTRDPNADERTLGVAVE